MEKSHSQIGDGFSTNFDGMTEVAHCETDMFSLVELSKLSNQLTSENIEQLVKLCTSEMTIFNTELNKRDTLAKKSTFMT